ncbi:MAG: hypothetical protein R6W71_05060 [Bacteroidales bacterium]
MAGIPRNNKPEVYFHVGLGKVASKYLQHGVFPHFRNIHYIPTRLFYRSVVEIQKGLHPSYLVSREFDTQFEEEVRKFARHFPDAHPILLLRRHDDWIASQYRRFAKNGFFGPFKEFIDPEKNEGRFGMESLAFYRKIEILKECFSNEPLVLIYDELLKSPWDFIDKIAGYCQAGYDKKDIRLQRRHTSYAEKQIRWMQLVNRRLNIHEPRYTRVPVIKFFQRIPFLLYRYLVLYSGLLVPASWLGNAPLIPPGELKRIRELTREDWERCVHYIAHHPSPIPHVNM